MSDFKPIRKAMVVIAVSNYDPPYEALPGTLTSAGRIANWARAPGEGRNYKVIEITDAPKDGRPGQPVTVERLRTEITDLLDTNIVDRLVIYFAGHGVVRSTAEEFWLLSHAGQDNGECVGVMAFTNGLKTYGIGVHNPDLTKGQLVVIADACRNVHSDGLNFVSNAVMTRKGKAVALQTDMFRATTLGAYSFQVKAVNGAEPYCLFSSVLCDALEGKVPEVIEEQYHPFSPVISNNKLADYLDQEVPRRAILLKEIMEPDNLAAIRLSHNYYDILPRAPAQSTNDPKPALPPIVQTPIDRPPITRTLIASEKLSAKAVIQIIKQLGIAHIDEVTLRHPPTPAAQEAIEQAASKLQGTTDIVLPASAFAPNAEFGSINPEWEKFVRPLVIREISPGTGPTENAEGAGLQTRGTAHSDLLANSSRMPRLQFEPEPNAAAGFRRSLARANLLAELSRDPKQPIDPRILFDGSGGVALPKAAATALFKVGFGWAYAPPSKCNDLPAFLRHEGGWTLAPSLERTITVILEELPGDALLRAAKAKDWDLSLSSGARLMPGTAPRVSDAPALAGRVREFRADRPNDAICAGYLFGLAGDNDSIIRLAHDMCQYGLPVDLAVLAADSLEWISSEGRWQILADIPSIGEDKDTLAPALPIKPSVLVRGLFPAHRQGWQAILDADHRGVPDLLRRIAEALVTATAVVLPDSAMAELADQFDYVILESPKI